MEMWEVNRAIGRQQRREEQQRWDDILSSQWEVNRAIGRQQRREEQQRRDYEGY
jgi:hypothetical protein